MNFWILWFGQISANERLRGNVPAFADMEQHPYGWLSLVPPLVAIGMAILTRKILLSLLASVFVGALILGFYAYPGVSQDQPTSWEIIQSAAVSAWQDHLWPTLLNPDKVSVFVFTCLMGAIVGMVNRAAGMRGLIGLMSPITHSVRGLQISTWISGMFVFFDDYANTMLLGTTYRSAYDRLKISREKLAFIVDSTAAPVAGLAIVSTWIAGELEYINLGMSSVTVDQAAGSMSAFQLFVASIPYRFYVVWALLFVLLTAITGRDFGPMLKAERRAREQEHDGPIEEYTLPEDLDWQRLPVPSELIPMDMTEVVAVAHDPTLAPQRTPARSLNALLPILVTVSAILGLMYQSGLTSYQAKLQEAKASATAESAAEIVPPLETWGNIFGNADSYGSLVWGSIIGLLFTWVWLSWQRIVPTQALLQAGGRGATHMIPALAILWLASTLSTMTSDSPTDPYQAELTNARKVAEAIAGIEKVESRFRTWDKWERVYETLRLHKYPETVIVETMAQQFNDPELFYLRVISRIEDQAIPSSFYGRYLTINGKQVDWNQFLKPLKKPKTQSPDGAQEPPEATVDHPDIESERTSTDPIQVQDEQQDEQLRVLTGISDDPNQAGPADDSSKKQEPAANSAGGNRNVERGLPREAARPPAGGNQAGAQSSSMYPVALTDPSMDGVWEAVDESLEMPYTDIRHRLHTGRYLANLLIRMVGPDEIDANGQHPFAKWLPTVIFVLAAFTAFSTGTSWGTMGIIMPLAIPLVASMLNPTGGGIDPNSPIFLATIAGVLAGAIFGDHCSPISDTTVLSSNASGCSHLAHVWTQMPYALTTAAVTIVFGTIPVGFGWDWWICLPLGTVVLIGIMFVIGRPVTLKTDVAKFGKEIGHSQNPQP